MTVGRHPLRWSLVGMTLVGLVSFAPTTALAQTGPGVISPDRLRAQAADLEKQGQWDSALQIYFRLLTLDRQQPEVRERLQVCLRHVLQSRRHRDPSFQQKVLSLPTPQALALFAEVLSKLQAHYVDRDKVQPARLFRAGLDEFLAALDDDTFRKQYLANVAEAKLREYKLHARRLWQDRGAADIPDAQAKLRELAAHARRALRLPNANVVILEFVCGACNSLDEFTAYLTPREVLAELTAGPEERTVVDAAMHRDVVGYVRITGFRPTTVQELESAIFRLKNDGMKVLVIDLRGNPGGLFDVSVAVAERFIAEGVIVSTQGQLSDVNQIYTSASGPRALDVPLVLLVDASTASAAEVVAGAFKDHQRATLIGLPTFGKGSIQYTLKLQTAEETDENGRPRFRPGALRITLARFFSPNGQPLSGVGVTPHIVEPDKDRQLETALDYATRLMNMMRMPTMMPPTSMQ